MCGLFYCMTWWVTRKKLTRKKGGPYYSGISGTNILNYSSAMSSLSGGDAAVATLVGGMELLVYASTRAMRVLGGDTGELMASYVGQLETALAELED